MILKHFLEHNAQNKTNYQKRQKLRVQSCYWELLNYRLIQKPSYSECAANSLNSQRGGLKCLKSPNKTKNALQLFSKRPLEYNEKNDSMYDQAE